MIYVYWGYEIDQEDNPVKAIKIGYTDNWEKRFNAHKSSRPTLKVLFTIDNGTQEDEYSIQTYFKDYQFPCGSTEWFYYRDEILNFFREHTTIEEIMKVVPRVAATKKTIPDKTLKFIASFIASDLDLELDSHKHLERLIIKRKLRNLDSLKIFLEAEGYPEESIDKAFNELNKRSSLSEAAIKFIEENIDTFTRWENMFKAFCELDESIKDEVIYYVPYRLKYFYDILGLERCRAAGYKYEDLLKELSIRNFDKNILLERIYSEFKELSKVPKSEIKKKLNEVYQSIGYNRVAKATDLKDWFELKRAHIPSDEKGKYIEGFELLKKKN